MNYQKFECVICGHIYDEEFGDPDGGIPAGTKWEDIPDDWVCPDCGVSKFDYEPLESSNRYFENIHHLISHSINEFYKFFFQQFNSNW